ncbi:MAG: trifunctional transcriptional activator/DNA repair protein Ada/methylated-DNA--[protein]-cysteine S-methyltransferase [marine benthic group bacterium]|nr:trifunctional transcriptional activator/DNA repair protein Ada/methylated-DNA--[protein]-cysteine S-methyltransferase [Gemmatimonadota bacterium]
MEKTNLPDRATMLRAIDTRDDSYDGVFWTAVKTTGIFCRPACPARKPKPENVEFFSSPKTALEAGYRPCHRCRPLEPTGETPPWLESLIRELESDPSRRWTDRDLRALGLQPERVRRWFQRHHGMTFHAYSRARRLGEAIGRIREGENVSRTAYAQGFESLSGFNEAFRKLLGKPPTGIDPDRVVRITRILTPLGPMLVGATDGALCLLEFVDRRKLETQLQRISARLRVYLLPGSNSITGEAERQVTAYFDRRLTEFRLPLEAPGTEFQQIVWSALREIPYGTTVSYGEVARRIGRPTAVRAVAGANGDNRIAILIPCHRVIGADGTLTGYGGGLWRKKRLLELESVQRDAFGV